MRTHDPRSGGAQGMDGREGARRSGAPGPHARGIVGGAGGGRLQSGGVWAVKTVKRPPQQRAQPRYTNYWAPLTHKRHPPQPAQPRHTPTTALREWGNNTSRRSGRSSRQNATTQCSMRREEQLTVQAPVKKQQPDEMSQWGLVGRGGREGSILNPPAHMVVNSGSSLVMLWMERTAFCAALGSPIQRALCIHVTPLRSGVAVVHQIPFGGGLCVFFVGGEDLVRYAIQAPAHVAEYTP